MPLYVPAGGGTLASLTDVDTTGKVDEDSLTWEASVSKWVPQAITGGAGGGGASGGLVFLQAQTASASAQLDFTSIFSATYDDYIVEGVDLVPATNAVILQMRVGTGGGPTYATTDYYGTLRGNGSSAGSHTTSSAPGSGVEVAKVVTNTANYGKVNFTIHVKNPQSAVNKVAYGESAYHDGTEQMRSVFGFLWSQTTALTALRFLFSSGNITSGVIRVYGVAKAVSDGVLSQSGGGGVTIPGLQASPDQPPTSPDADNDEFDTTDTVDPMTGWTTFGTPTHDINNSAKSHYSILAPTDVNQHGVRKGGQTAPFTITAKLASYMPESNFQGVGICISNGTKIVELALVYNGSASLLPGLSVEIWTDRLTYASQPYVKGGFFAVVPLYLRIVVTTNTSVSYQYSADGLNWRALNAAAHDPVMTVSEAGIISTAGHAATAGVRGLFDWVRFT